MQKVSRESLLTLEAYARERPQWLARLREHRRDRRLALGPHVTLLFEDELTVRFQIQEMLHIEKTFDETGITDEIEVYNPLIPDGSNFKATMLIEYTDPEVRKRELARLRGVERQVWLEVAGADRRYAIADEDLERENEEKTSAVHFLRFELSGQMVAALKAGAELSMGIDHEAYQAEVRPVPAATRAALLKDLD